MKVSVIIPAFNAEKTINACIQALLSQSLKPSEIIAVDDGSKDKTLQALKGFGKKIRIVSKKNSGPAAARNNGAKAAKGEILVFTDSDCIASKDFLKELAKPFKNPKIAGAQGRYLTRQTALMALLDQCDIETRYEKMKKQEFIDFIGSYAAAYRKKDFFQAGGFDEQYKMASGEDPDLSFKMSSLGKKMVFCEKAIVFHKHPESVMKYLRTKFYRGYWRVLLYKKFPEKKTKDSYTSKGTLLGTALAGLSVLSVLGVIIYQIENEPAFQAIMLAILTASIVLMWVLERKLLSKCCSKKFSLGIFSIPIIVLRNFAQGFGIILGMLKAKGVIA